MKNWWVPGLQIGYEHTFIHQVADFILSLDGNRAAAPVSGMDWRQTTCRCSFEICADEKVGKDFRQLIPFLASLQGGKDDV